MGQADAENRPLLRNLGKRRPHSDRDRAIAFVLLRLAHDADKIVASPLAFARLIRTNLMQRRAIAELLKPPPKLEPKQPTFNFGPYATREARRRRDARATMNTSVPMGAAA